MRDQQYERKREFAVSAFQRKSILALQIAVTDLIKAAYSELDRMIAESAKREHGRFVNGKPHCSRLVRILAES